jgi:Predicted nucleic-acid-binding protein containing a Zn-ribbon
MWQAASAARACVPLLLSDRITWQRATGQGRVTSWTIVHKAWFPAFRDDIPYNVVQIELDEGPG